MDDGMFAFDAESWRADMPLQLLDFLGDENVRAVVVLLYTNKDDEEYDKLDMMLGLEPEVSSFLLLGMLEDGKLMLARRAE